ncbi:MAG: ABC transporter permease subunit [Flavobacteriales bacterium]
MATNAIVHLRTHPERVRKYSENIIASHTALESRTQLYLLLQKGPGTLYKRPSSLAFVAHGGEAFLPGTIENGGSWSLTGFSLSALKSVWWMGEPRLNRGESNPLRSTFTEIDWVFIITYLLSLLPFLFTYDSIAGEQEQGTLRLCLANPISRHTLFIGKFFATLLAVLIPFYCAMLCNLAIVSTNNWTQFDGTDWIYLAIIGLIASCYAALFIAVGLLVSATTQERQWSCVLLLFIWVTVVVFMPSTLGTLATKWMPPLQTHHQFQRAKQGAIEQLTSDFTHKIAAAKERQLKAGNAWSKLQKLAKMSPEDARQLATSLHESEKVDDSQLRLMAARVNEDVKIREHLNRQRFEAQRTQIQHMRAITRFSPAALVQYTIESMAGTGYNHHLQFLSNVDLYIRDFRHFIDEMDRSDPESLHIIGIPKGMSKKPISPRLIPKFEDKITFRETFNTAIVDMLCLVLLLILFLFTGFWVFLRADV